MTQTRLVVLVLLLAGLARMGQPPAALATTPYERLREAGLADYWHRLLYYDESLIGGYVSAADSPAFFLHKEGRHDPAAELEANLAAFQDPEAQAGFFKSHPQCTFPERYRFLKAAGLVHTQDRACEEFQEWRAGIGATAIILTFSSAFPNNPASAFGHTFIRFRKEGAPGLLDYTAGYAALTGADTLGLVYAFKGLFGGYAGRFIIDPYYLKVDEYNNSESRDLYEYELNLPTEAVERIVNHLWELYASGYFDYYFLDENCSYLLSRMLDLAGPEWNLAESYRWYYLPVDSLKRLAEIPGAIRSKNFRPSLNRQIAARLQSLTPDRREQVRALFEAESVPVGVSDAQVLDALVALWNFRKRNEKDDFGPEEKQRFREILLYRAGIKEKSPEMAPENDPENWPEHGHGATRIALGGGSRNDAAFQRVRFFSGVHNLMASDLGMEPLSQIDLLGFALEHDPERRRTRLSHATAVDILSLHPDSFYDPQFSWKVSVLYGPVHDLPCVDCQKVDLNLAFGKTLGLGSGHSVAYALAGLFGERSGEFVEPWRLGPSLEWAIYLNPWRAYRLRAGQAYRLDLLGESPRNDYWVHSIEQSLALGRQWEILLNSRYTSGHGSTEILTREHALEVAFYF